MSPGPIAITAEPAVVHPTQTYPLRIASIDMGSNAIRFMAVEFTSDGQYEVLSKHRVPIRLGHAVFRTGKLTARAMEAAVEAVATFEQAMDDLGITFYRAVATSAVREARNGRTFLKRLRKQTGLTVEAITGAEEARLVLQAVRSRMPFDGEPWMLADLGGGSLEVALVNENGVLVIESHTIGTVRLLEELESTKRDRAEFRNLVDEYLAGLGVPTLAQHRGPAGFMASGGNMEALAELMKAPLATDKVSVVETKALGRFIKDLAKLAPDERIAKYGLRPDRADVILPAAMVYHRLARLIGTDQIHVPHVGVKEGILFDLEEDLTSHQEHVRVQAKQTHSSALTLGRQFQFDEAHATHVTHLAARLFDELQPLHGLDEGDRRILLAAAMLHDLGQFLSYNKHHKHSYYLISHSELAGFTRTEREVMANVARYHRKAKPSKKHDAYRQLSPATRDRVTRMAALLRLADALDREHQQRVHDLDVHLHDDTVQLVLQGTGDLDLERWAVGKKSKLFEATFGLEVQVVSPSRSQSEANPE